MAERDLYTTREVAELLGVSQRYVQRLAKEQLIGSLVVQTSRRPVLRIRASDIVAFADKWTVERPARE